MGRPAIGCYIGNKDSKILSYQQVRYSTDLSVVLGKLDKGDNQWHLDNYSGTIEPPATYYHP